MTPKQARRQLALLKIEREFLRERLAQREAELAAVEKRIRVTE